jgi:hypothetical protein
MRLISVAAMPVFLPHKREDKPETLLIGEFTLTAEEGR